MKVAVAVSGGVDSLAAMLLLRERGYSLIALHGIFYADEDREGVRLNFLTRVCSKLGVKLKVLDLSQEFELKVVRPFIKDYLSGLTPNPCAICNQEIKFGLFKEKARQLGADCLATGHYARLSYEVGTCPRLFRGKDLHKEQSYFLSLVQAKDLQGAMLPLGDLSKNQALDLVKASFPGLKFPVESQEICFIPENDYRLFLQKKRKSLPGPGEIWDLEGRRLGRHKGLHCYTIGQRRGLGIPDKEPLYVVDKNMQKNVLLVGYKRDLQRDSFWADKINFIKKWSSWPEDVYVQTIYRQGAKKARVREKGDKLEVIFKNPRKRAVPGQVSAFYSEEGEVLGGGRVNA